MKKFKHLLVALMFMSFMAVTPVFAVTDTVCTDASMCPACPQVNGAVSSALSKVTGMNFIVSSIAESQVRKQLNKALNGDFKVDITPFGAKSLIDGKFKKITAYSDTAYVDGFYLSNINAQSLCPYNHFVYKDGKVYTNENFLLSFSADVTSNDLQKIISTPEYLKLLNSMNVNVGNVSVFKVFDPKAEVQNNRLVFSLKVMSPLTMMQPKTIATSMGIAVQNGRITMTDIQTVPALATLN